MKRSKSTSHEVVIENLTIQDVIDKLTEIANSRGRGFTMQTNVLQILHGTEMVVFEAETSQEVRELKEEIESLEEEAAKLTREAQSWEEEAANLEAENNALRKRLENAKK